LVNSSEWPAVAIRAILLADILADLLQFEPHSRYRVTSSPEVLACEIALLAAQASIAIALFPLRNPITEATTTPD
jgi:hypothetical protein